MHLYVGPASDGVDLGPLLHFRELEFLRVSTCTRKEGALDWDNYEGVRVPKLRHLVVEESHEDGGGALLVLQQLE